jgi:ADP-heptose:LPS heptosyltransferase
MRHSRYFARTRCRDPDGGPIGQTATMPEPPILIIKLGALGNVVLAMNAFAAIRAFHATVRISLLTTAPYADWLRLSPWFDEVLVDSRPAWWNLSGVYRLRRMLTRPGFTRVYDLQTSGRSSHYFRLLPRTTKPEWSGIVSRGSHPDRDPDRARMHDIDRQTSQLRQAGIVTIPSADLSWCQGDIDRFGLPQDFVVLVPGSAPHRPEKRWPASRYQALAQALRTQGLTPIVVGSTAEAPIARDIPAALDLTGQTSFGDLADLGRAARFAIGNDTGPMHLLAAMGCPEVVLFSHASDPALCAPRGPDVRVLRRPNLASLEVEAVLAELPDPVDSLAIARGNSTLCRNRHRQGGR